MLLTVIALFTVTTLVKDTVCPEEELDMVTLFQMLFPEIVWAPVPLKVTVPEL